MKIQKITSQHNNDFTAILECEHCGHTQELMTGYHDRFYHNNVLPSIACENCNKDRAGNDSRNFNGFDHIPKTL